MPKLNKILFIACFHAGIWGMFGFFMTLLFGFLASIAGLAVDFFYYSLVAFAITGIVIGLYCVLRCCKKMKRFE